MKEKNTNQKSDAALREEAVSEFWKENKIFEKTLEKNSPKGEFIFYDGPPTANAKPALHHLASRIFKDAIPRYKTMSGFHVRRKAGWDTHGLPVELQIEKKLKLNSKKEIEEYGIAKFNKECRDSVWEFVGDWDRFTERSGYWLDQADPYVTYHNTYIESLWNVVKKVNEQGLLYKDYKVVPWCPRCGTALSSHELAQGYEDVKDLSVYAKFKIKGQENTFILAWTTTPWTLPGNVALAVREDIDYVKLRITNEQLRSEEFYILAKARLSIIEAQYEVVQEMKGKDLVGVEYEPLYPYFADTISGSEKAKLDKAYKVYAADFVNTEDGTGVVHTAVMYGQDDFVMGTKVGLPKHHLVGLDGKFLPGTGIFEGRFVKDEEVAVDVIKDLAHRGDGGLLFKKEKYEHSYPHCWRCKTPLIYYARDSWYIKISDPKIKGKLISENKSINWEPSHIREGRFGEWLREIKDWAISRERYWGTPLPIWQKANGEFEVIGSLDELKTKTKKSGNKYFVMRHGGTENNFKELVSYKKQATDHLTKEGKVEVVKQAKNILKNKNIDLIIASPFTRTRETAELVSEAIGVKDIIYDERIAEINPGEFDGKNWNAYHEYLYKNTGPDWFTHKIAGGESLKEVQERTASALYDLEKKYKGKNILIITHGGPAWLLFVNAGLFTPDKEEYQVANTHVFVADFKKFNNAEVRELPFIPVPHNEAYELDFHKPYIDQVELVSEDGEVLTRTKEVMDVWFDSGAMPFAQDHYPFENKSWVEGRGYPADYICEAIDQTRGWFYTLHAVGVLMGRGKAYKNVICLGHLLDAKGKKMSKSVGNVVEPFEAMDKYGVDTLRLWMYSVNQPGESKNFDEKTVMLLHSQVFGLLYNVLAFYELYRDKDLENEKKSNRPQSKNILDQWIIARLEELIKLSTDNLDNYKLLEPVRAMRDFIGDLSTWHLRRSRERIKEGDIQAKKTLYFILKTVAKLLAPVAPFTADDIWLKLRNKDDAESVHLAAWPKISRSIFDIFSTGKNYSGILKNMRIVREVVSLGLKERQVSNIPVRQPLATLKVSAKGGSAFGGESGKLPSEYFELIKDELNVKEVVSDASIASEVELDTKITEELKKEGGYRELVRALQDMRKTMGLTPSDVITLSIDTDTEGKKLVEKFETEIKKTVFVSEIKFSNNDGPEVKIDDLVFKAKIDKI